MAMPCRYASWILLAVLWQRPGVQAKVQIRRLKLGPSVDDQGWSYLSKFGFARGVGTYAFRAKFVGSGRLKVPAEYNLSVETYLDEDWPSVETIPNPCKRSRIAKRVKVLTVDGKGAWGPWTNSSVRQTIRPHIWYFAVSMCNASEALDRAHYVNFEFQALQEDGSHFSYEHMLMPSANLVVLAGFTIFMYVFVKRCYAFFVSAGSVHPVIWTLAAVMLSQFAAQTFHTGHLVMYRTNGQGVQPIELLSEILFMVSQILQSSLLIMIALGYTLVQSKIGDLDVVILVCVSVGFVHLILVFIGKLQDDSSTRFHEHEGVVGWTLLTLRLVLFAWFVWAANSTGARAGLRLQTFLRRFTIAGSLYFLAYPVIFLIIGLFAPYLRAPIMASGQMGMQLASNAWLSFLFLRRGDYFQVSSLSESYLPGGSPSQRCFKDE